MIDYDAHAWRAHLFEVRGSMIKQITYRVLVCIGFAGLVVLADHYWFPLAVPATAHGLVGVALGLLLVFRTNASYDRFWEGRKLWGSIVNETRNLARHSRGLIHPTQPALHAEIIQRTIAFPYACMQLLRGTAQSGEHVPLAIAVKLTQLLREAQTQGAISDYARVAADYNVQQLVDCIGACERIHKTPLPFAYVVHLRRALILYCFSLPFALVGDFGGWTVLAAMFVAYVFFGIEEIGVQIEDPFGLDDNDLPLERICATIEQNLLALDAPQKP